MNEQSATFDTSGNQPELVFTLGNATWGGSGFVFGRGELTTIERARVYYKGQRANASLDVSNTHLLSDIDNIHITRSIPRKRKIVIELAHTSGW